MMDKDTPCSPEITDILTKILTTGLLRIRSLGWSDEGERCAVESDHVHNLPSLLTNYSRDKLEYYLNVERSSYIAQRRNSDLAVWMPLWEQLQGLLKDRD